MSLEKIANHQELSKADIIAAAHEVLQFEKEAALADRDGRDAAHEFVDGLVKKAEDEAAAAAAAAPAAAPVEAAPAAAPVEAAPAEAEKTAELNQAVSILKKYNIIK